MQTNFVNFKNDNLSDLIFVQFEKYEEVKDDWIDPYEGLWLRLFTLLVYIIEVIAAMIMFAFVRYETGGLAGHYRTFINQLLSYLYGAVSLFQIPND